MRIDITARQVEITPALREYVTEKFRKLERLLDGPVEIHVVLAVEKHRHRAEVQVKSRTAVLNGLEETDELLVAIGEVANKLERQALKHKEKVTEKKRRDGRRVPEIGGESPAAAGDPGDGRDAATRVIRSERYRLKPLSPVDAVLELEGTGEDLLVFRNAETERVNVVYRRRDGHFGLVDPEF